MRGNTRCMERKNQPALALLRDHLVLIAIIGLVLVTLILQPRFFSVDNLTNILRQFGPLSLMALGMTFVIIGGFIDLSISGSISLAAVLTVMMIQPLGQVPALILGLLIGLACGLLNAFLITTAGAMKMSEALFISFGMSMVYSAIALLISGGATQHMNYVEVPTSVFEFIGKGSLGLITASFLIFLVCLLALHLFQSRSYMGRVISYVGGNKEAALLAGLPVKFSVYIMFALSGLMCALGSIVLFSRITTASPVLGVGYDTNAILAVVVGGTSLKGGKGSLLKTVLGTLLIILMSNCLNLLGVTTDMQSVVKGIILVIAIWLDNRREQ